ncbi:MAG TPA: FAD-dependent monooxygenase [Pseudonocardia sp.]|jgi:2-polyprenyl-6-methoxyphenol hydroxylase-like FAD-dependent oxidoreductase|uniref:FAD-dependent monooxygenase n=1 Tax=Pseudonocardia sp. TaxID=60912 RepID=UPI002F402708
MDAEVLIVGAGPTGLLLAGDLAEAGVAVTVLERQPLQQSNLTRAFAVHARTLEVLDARGVADELVRTGQRVGRLRLLDSATLPFDGLPSRFPFVLVTPQYQTEQVLARRAEAAGARFEHGLEVVALRQDREGVEVDVRAGEGAGDAGVRTLRAAYLVGTDGVHSTVRQELGEAFPGHPVVRSMMLADVRLTEQPPSPLTVNAGEPGLVLIAPFGEGWYRVVAWDRHDQRPDSDPVDVERLRELVRRVLGTDYGMHEVRWTSRFHSDERQVAHYRVGRAFLAGDAAHVHSPAGGQGMNTGLQDAANLGWRLVAALRGWAPSNVPGAPDVLDGYQAERHRVGRLVLRGSGGIIRAGLIPSAALRRLRNVLLGVVSRVPVLTGKVTGAISGVSIRYPAPKGAHRLVGSRAPDLALLGDDADRLYQALRCGQFVLLTSADSAREVSGWTGPVRRVTPLQPLDVDMLVRPDGYVAWAADHQKP